MLALTGIGLTILGQKNVIVRNMKISKVLAAYGDGVTIQLSTNVWVDHCDFSGDETVGKVSTAYVAQLGLALIY